MKDFLGNELAVGDEVAVHDVIDGSYCVRRIILQKSNKEIVCTGYYNDVDSTEIFRESELIKVIRE